MGGVGSGIKESSLLAFETEVSDEQRDNGEMKSIIHIENCPCPVLLLLRPLLFRNHDCVNMKPGHINCSCFQKGKKNNGFFSVVCFCASA